MDWNPIQGLEIFLVASCYRNWDKLRPDGLLGLTLLLDGERYGKCLTQEYSAMMVLCQGWNLDKLRYASLATSVPF